MNQDASAPRSSPGAHAGSSVLILGWHARAVDVFEAHGYRVVSAVAAKDLAQAHKHSDARNLLVVGDPGRFESVLSALSRAEMAASGFEVVATLHEIPLIAAAVLGGYARRPGMALETAVALRDKFVQKRLARAAGLRVADCRSINTLSVLECVPWERPLVVKPFDEAGTRDAFAVKTPTDLSRLLGSAVPGGSSGPWLVEEFVDGAELHVDGVVRNGDVTFLSVSRYLHNLITIRSGSLVGSVTLDPATHRERYRQAREVAETSLRAFGHRDGLFHLEVFESEGEAGLVFSECAGRIGGGMIRDVNAHMFGVDLVDEYVRAITGLPPSGVSQAQPTEVCGWIQFPAPRGRITRIPSREEIMRRPGCVEARLALSVGAQAPDVSSGTHLMAAKAMFAADDEDELRHRMTDAAGWFQAEVVTESDAPAEAFQ